MRPSSVDNAAIQVERAGRANTPVAQNIRCVFHVREQKVQQCSSGGSSSSGSYFKGGKKGSCTCTFYFPPLLLLQARPRSADVRSTLHLLLRTSGDAGKYAAPRALCVNIEYFGAPRSRGGCGVELEAELSPRLIRKALEDPGLVYKARV